MLKTDNEFLESFFKKKVAFKTFFGNQFVHLHTFISIWLIANL